MKCYECGKKAQEKHHIVPKALGGTKTIALCSKCHCKIHGLKGGRLQATSLIKYGMYKKYGNDDLIRVFAFCSCEQFDFTHYNAFSCYKRFSGDIEIERSKFNRLILTVSEWIKDERWDWFLEIASRAKWSHVLVSDILTDYYKIQTDVNVNEHVYTISNPADRSYAAWVNHNVATYWKDKSARYRAVPSMYKSGWLEPLPHSLLIHTPIHELLRWCNELALVVQSNDSDAILSFCANNAAVIMPHTSPIPHSKE